MVADRLRCRLVDIGGMAIAEFNLTVAGYAERNKRSSDG